MSRSRMLALALFPAALAAAGCSSPAESTASRGGNAAAALSSNWYAAAPYVMPLENSPPDLAAVMGSTNQKSFMLAFVLASGGTACEPAWDQTAPVATDTRVKAVIDGVRAKGGDVSIAAGGYGGVKLGQVCGTAGATAAAYQKVIDRYALRAIDFDLEEPEIENAAAIANELGAAQILQRNNPGLYVSVTMPGIAAGVNWFGSQLLANAKSLGFTPDNYSIMPFDGGFNGAASQIAALEGLHATLMSTFGWDSATAYAHAGVSMMNGRTDAAEYFTQADFQAVLDYALSHGLGRYTYWSVNRDRQCVPADNNGALSGSCSSVAQAPWEFTTFTARFAGATPPVNGGSSGGTSSGGTSSGGTSSGGNSGSCTAAAWSASAVYLSGALVSYGGHTWKAQWWTQNEIPGVSTSGVWVDQGACSGGTSSGGTSSGGTSSGGTSSGGTSSGGNSGSCTAAAWSASAVYLSGALVSYGGHTWKAQWWTQNEIPGVSTSGVWVDQGACSGGTSSGGTSSGGTSSGGSSGGAVTLGVGSLASFNVTTAGYTDRYLRHQDGVAVTSSTNASSDARSRLDATFYVRAALASGAPSNCYSFESLDYPGQFLRHSSSRLRKDAPDGSDLFTKDATFCARTGRAGNGTSLESYNFPGYFVRHVNAEVYIASATGTNAWDGGSTYDADATWNVTAGLATTADLGGGSSSGGGTHLMAYFAQWGIYQRAYYVKNIDTSGSAAKLDVINYAFGNVVNNRCSVGVSQLGVGDAWADYQKGFDAASSVDGVADNWSQTLKGNWNQLRKLKAKYPNLKVMISLGGWTWSDGFYSASQPANRAAFVASCIDAYVKGNLPVDPGSGAGGAGAAAGVFDGIDLDWEYPGTCGNNAGCGASAADKANFTALLAEFRRQLDAVRPGLLLTVAVGAGADKVASYDVPGVAQYADRINLMTYDFFGAWSAGGPTAFHSPLRRWTGMPSNAPMNRYTADDAVQLWKAGGAPASKLHLGIGFYGRGWTGVTNANNGLNQSASGPAPGTYEPGVEDYKVLKNLGWPAYTSSEAGTAWIFNGSTFWSYDTPATIATKMAYAKTQGLGGAFGWELDGDDATGSLLGAMRSGLK